MTSRWIRLDTTWSKSKWVAKLPASSRLAWVELLCYMKAHGDSTSVKALCADVAAHEWGVTVTAVTRLLDAAIKDGALVVDGDKWVITGWHRQTDTTNAKRQAAYRERQKELTEPSRTVTPVTRDVTPVTPTETETETTTSVLTEPETSSAGRDSEGDFCNLVRKHLWQSKDPPAKDWNMGREINIRRGMVKRGEDPEVIDGVVALYVGDPVTMRIYWANTAMPRWTIDSSQYLNSLPVKLPELSATKVGDVLDKLQGGAA